LHSRVYEIGDGRYDNVRGGKEKADGRALISFHLYTQKGPLCWEPSTTTDLYNGKQYYLTSVGKQRDPQPGWPDAFLNCIAQIQAQPIFAIIKT
jgi:hypothetical protein